MVRRLTLVTNPDVCNLRCPLCFLNQRGSAYGKGEMPLDVAFAAIEKYHGAGAFAVEGKNGLREVIPSTMGEPLLYSKFAELLDYCLAARIPLNLTTNGSFPGVWRTCEGMAKLVRACSDIKVSCMGFSEDVVREMMPGLTFEKWKENVERLLEVADGVKQAEGCCAENGDKNGARNSDKNGAATVSLQVTLHKKMLSQVREILAWAESTGIARVKWNMPVFIASGERLRAEYGVSGAEAAILRNELRSDKVRCEGSLFFDALSVKKGAVNAAMDSNEKRTVHIDEKCVAHIDEKRATHIEGKCAVADGDLKESARVCDFFADEVWVMPDGSVEHCPNPEKRFGNPAAPGAKCEGCLMFCG